MTLTIVDHPLVRHKLSLMRDKATPTSQFRQLLREISHLIAYEVTRDLPLELRDIETPMRSMQAPVLAGKKLALVSILRAGNGLLDGVLELIPSARVGFVGLYRDEKTLKPVQYYFKVPDDLQNRVVIAVDPVKAVTTCAVPAVIASAVTRFSVSIPAAVIAPTVIAAAVVSSSSIVMVIASVAPDVLDPVAVSDVTTLFTTVIGRSFAIFEIVIAPALSNLTAVSPEIRPMLYTAPVPESEITSKFETRAIAVE